MGVGWGGGGGETGHLFILPAFVGAVAVQCFSGQAVFTTCSLIVPTACTYCTHTFACLFHFCLSFSFYLPITEVALSI